ncbi:1985_t:CDS:2 [Cetraspora pellucida]|uniref:1985_t:CDS:1 n=1 Tax=Cetraspora pellucida TaxID=1433469 RepID=A0ACA9JXF6_9GLOM|nr:1985_t:CDS:2 [Cetraspora pellucida]
MSIYYGPIALKVGSQAWKNCYLNSLLTMNVNQGLITTNITENPNIFGLDTKGRSYCDFPNDVYFGFESFVGLLDYEPTQVRTPGESINLNTKFIIVHCNERVFTLNMDSDANYFARKADCVLNSKDSKDVNIDK